MALKLLANPIHSSSSQSQSQFTNLLASSRTFRKPSFLLQWRSKVIVLSRCGTSSSQLMVRACVKEDVNVAEKAGSDWGKVSAVLFDMDGVLCNSEEPSRLAAVDVFAEMGVQVTVEDFVPFMGTGEANFLGGVASVKGVADFNTEAAKKRFFEIYLDKYAKPNSGIGFPSVLELITECKNSGVKVAIASSADRIKVDATLAAAGLSLSMFDAIVSADAFENLKPAPDIFIAASKILNVPPSECIVIGDVLAGVQAAKAAKMSITRRQSMSATAAATAELPYHQQQTNSDKQISQKSLLNLLTTKSLQHLKQIHSLILKTNHLRDHYISGSLIKSYANPYFNTFDSSLLVFHQVPNPNVFVWNSIIKACFDNNKHFLALLFYSEMVGSDSKPNKFTYPMLFKACMVVKSVEEGCQIHCHVVKNGFMEDGYVKSAGIQMYSSFGQLYEARMILDYGESDVICFNAMLDGYLKFGEIESARRLFESMVKKNVCSWNAMVTGLAKCGLVEDAREVFNEMPERDEISWSAMIDGCNKNGCFKEALGVFRAMQREKIKPKKFVLSSVALACANVGSLDQGKWIHGYARRNSIELDGVLGTAFLDMYAKLGRLDLAWEVFESMKTKEVSSWNAMIGGLAMHGRAKDAIELFLRMENESLKPDEITFVGLLNACAHGGLVDEGLDYFNRMVEVNGIPPTVQHYGCMVDLLGRVGRLAEAEELIKRMPMTPTPAVWGALLGACRVHGNVDTGERIGKMLIDLEPQNGGRYALLSNIYAKAGRWEDVERLRATMKENGVKTSTGRSTIDLDGVIHEFKIGEGDHPRSREIYAMVEEMITKLELEGYVPKTSEVLFDIDEDEKETTLWRHSEKLAIAFGLISTSPGTPIRVTKNLRMCEDCHSAIKLISSVYERDIVVRDRLRFHHFRNGKCSCKDFW